MASTLPISSPPTAANADFGDRQASSDLARVLREGLFAGMAGYLAVVAIVAVYDMSQGYALFHTPALLGGYFIMGLRGAAELGVAAEPVLAYNGIHLLISLLAGTAAAFLVLEAERLEGFWYVGFMAALMGSTAIIALGGALAVEGAGLMSWSTVVAATVAWFGGMLAYLAWAHGDDLRQFRENLED